MLNPIRLSNDIFDDPKLSDQKLRTYSDDQLIRIANNNPGGIYTGLITATTTAYTAYYGNMTNEAVILAVSEGLTVAMNGARTIVWDKLSTQQGLLVFLFGEESSIYQQFLPQGLTEYHNAALDNLTIILDRYETAAVAHLTAGYPLEVTAVATMIANYKAARTAQRDAFSQTDTLRTGRRETRKVLTVQLTRNLLILASDFIDNPDRFEDYYDAALLPIGTSNKGDDTSLTLSGMVTDSVTGLPLVGARVLLGPEGAGLEVLTGTGGLYAMEIPELEETTEGTMYVILSGYDTLSRAVTINPGEDQTQNFGLTPNP